MNHPLFIVWLTDTQLSVYRASRSEVRLLATFAEFTRGIDELPRLVGSWRSSRVHVITDLAEEEFHYETLPALARADRKAFFQRKLDQHFRQTPYRHTAVQPAGKRGMPGKLQLSALVERQKIDALLACLLEARCAIAGLHSAPLASADLLPRLQLPAKPRLLITSVPDYGQRHSYFTPEGLRYTRLVHIPAGREDPSLADEVRKTSQFLISTRQLDQDEALDILIVEEKEPAPAACGIDPLQHDAPQIHIHRQRVTRLAAQLKFPAQARSWIELLCLALAHDLVSDHYLPASAARYLRLQQMEKVLRRGAVSVVIAGLFLTLFLLYRAHGAQKDIQLANQALQQQSERLRRFNSQLDALGSDRPAAMIEADTLYRNHIASWPDIEATSQAISQILTDFPRLVLERFTWHASPGPDLSAAQENLADPEKAPASLPAPSGQRWQIIDLAGQIQPSATNRRHEIEAVEQLARRLSRLPNSQVQILRQPLDPSPQGQIRSSEPETPASTDFLIRLVIAPAGEARQ